MKYCRKIKYVALILLMLSAVTNVPAQQSLADIKRKQEQLKRQISESTKLLKSTERRRKNTVNQIYILDRQIRNRKNLIQGYEMEIGIISKQIKQGREKMDSIDQRISMLKDEYATVIRKYYEIYKQNGGVLAYIFASEDLNQAYKRMKYYQQFLNFGKKLYKELEESRKKKEEEISALEEHRRAREEALLKLKDEQKKLLAEKRKKNRYLQNLKRKEKEIRRDIAAKRKIATKLADVMEKMIREEKEKSKRGIALTPEEKLIAGNFSKNKGKLPWPTQRGIIVDYFGEHRHPVLKNVTVRNDGIDIMTEKAAKARAVFEGEVRKIIAIPGANETVIIKHGNYYTVYQNVYKVSVKTGQHVNIKQPIGTIFTDNKSGETILHFEIWEGMKKMNPEIWLAQKK